MKSQLINEQMIIKLLRNLIKKLKKKINSKYTLIL